MIDHPSQDKLVFNWAKLSDRENRRNFVVLLLFELHSVHCNITNELIGVINQTLSALRYWPHSSRHFLNIRAEINWAEKCISYSEM